MSLTEESLDSARFATIFSKLTDGVKDSETHLGIYTALRISPSSRCAVFAARHLSSGMPALILEVGTRSIPAGFRLPESTGFHAHAEPAIHGREGRTRVVLALSNKIYIDVFMSLADDVSSEIAGVRGDTLGLEALVNRLSVWHDFFRRIGIGGLSAQERRGLYGELWFLSRHLRLCLSPDEAVIAWTGPEGKPQDFQFSGTGLEIKTTTTISPSNVHINNLRQLDDISFDRLYLHVIGLEENRSSGHSLKQMVDEIRGWVVGHSLKVFNDALLRSGYVDDAPDLIDLPLYHIRTENSFIVRAGFPRILEVDLMPGLSAVEYTLDLNACQNYAIDIDQELAIHHKTGIQ